VDKKVFWIAGGALLFILVLVLAFKGKGQPGTTIDKPATAVNANARALYEQAQGLVNGGDLVQAKEAYRQIVMETPDFDNISGVQQELENLNIRILFSNVAAPEKTVEHVVASGDTLGKIAKKYATTVDLIKKSNNLPSDVIRVGQKLRVWTGTFNIYVDKSQNILMVKDGEEVLKVYNVSTGSNNSTPVGKYTITSRLVDPVWFNKGVVLPPESPQNVLGTRWLGFDLPGYGIHGTIEPEMIGQQVTAGCVRMRNEDVEELYSFIPVGTEVTIVN